MILSKSLTVCSFPGRLFSPKHSSSYRPLPLSRVFNYAEPPRSRSLEDGSILGNVGESMSFDCFLVKGVTDVTGCRETPWENELILTPCG